MTAIPFVAEARCGHRKAATAGIVNANITAGVAMPAAPLDTNDLARTRQEVTRPSNRNIRARFRPVARCVPNGGSASK